MDTRKHHEFFNPTKAPTVHIVGCGAIGSTIATQVTRLGVDEIHLWDFDSVESKNIANQSFYYNDINKKKTQAVKEQLNNINPACKIHTHERYTDQSLEGIIFLAVDSIKVRKEIVEQNRYNTKVVGFIDARMRLTSGQIYTATFEKQSSIKHLLETMNFTDEEAKDSTPISACGTALNVRPTVTLLGAYATAEFMNMVLDGEPKHNMIVADVLHATIMTTKFRNNK
jgi:molybdopterin/thiamine biosynthesis adenylyltransferase